jgi:hypothetical protein
MKNVDDMSLLNLIDRWHAHERDSDPEREQARHDLELRITKLEGVAIGLGSAMLAQMVGGTPEGVFRYRADADRTAANLANRDIRGNLWVQ